MHKPDQSELQLDRSQLSYSEYLGSVPQEAAQPNIVKKAYYNLLSRLNLNGYIIGTFHCEFTFFVTYPNNFIIWKVVIERDVENYICLKREEKGFY